MISNNAVIILFLYLLQYTSQRNIPPQLIFDEESMENQADFKQRLNRLQETGYTSHGSFSSQSIQPLHISLFKEFVDLFKRNFGDMNEYDKRFQIFQVATLVRTRVSKTSIIFEEESVNEVETDSFL